MNEQLINAIAPVVILLVVTFAVTGTILLRPLVSRLAVLLEAMAREKSEHRFPSGIEHLTELMERLDGRVSVLEDRQNFTEAFLASPERKSLQAPGGMGDSEGGGSDRSQSQLP
jgi:hypothetical protein